MADEALSDAKYLLHDNRLKGAANRAHYAMFHGASAALSQASIPAPKKHKTLISLFYHQFVETGRMPRQLHRDLVKAFRLRQQGDYEILSRFGTDEVREVVEMAEAFVAEVRRLVGV
ncbi:MAG: HEPN domain-containing protein [Chloroflexi bacterium]|nr:HEPN domain-containing protein [Chloroflexota bacterium]